MKHPGRGRPVPRRWSVSVAERRRVWTVIVILLLLPPSCLVVFGLVDSSLSPVAWLIAAMILLIDVVLLRRFAWAAVSVELTSDGCVVFERPVGVRSVRLDQVRSVRQSWLDEDGAERWGAVIVTDDGAVPLTSKLPRDEIANAFRARNPRVHVSS